MTRPLAAWITALSMTTITVCGILTLAVAGAGSMIEFESRFEHDPLKIDGSVGRVRFRPRPEATRKTGRVQPALESLHGQQHREPARGIPPPYVTPSPPTTPPLSKGTAPVPTWEPWVATAYSGLCILPRPGIPEPTTTQRTASGVYPVPNWSIAADRRYAYGTVLLVSHGGIITSRIVHDRGRAIKGRRLDLYMEDCGRARKWGVRRVMVKILSEPLGGTRKGAE